MELNISKPVKVQASTLKISAKCSDCFAATLYDEAGALLKEYDGYVPEFMPGDHYGDYVMLEIDIDTGRILNWQVPSVAQMEQFVSGDSVD